MPAAEAVAVAADERGSYELAFHVLPTVAEGEVAAVFDTLKARITKDGGELFDEEAPQRFDLAYEIVKHLEGKHRHFKSAYFGWVRFKAESEAINHLLEEMEADPQILRHLLLKLTKVEEQNPFRFHEALAAEKMVTSVEESAVVPDFSKDDSADDEATSADDDTDAEPGEADEAEIEAALNKDEA